MALALGRRMVRRVRLVRTLENWPTVWRAARLGRAVPPLRLRGGLVITHAPEDRAYDLLHEVFLERAYLGDGFYRPAPGDVVVDGGAHVGFFALQLYSRTGHPRTLFRAGGWHARPVDRERRPERARGYDPGVSRRPARPGGDGATAPDRALGEPLPLRAGRRERRGRRTRAQRPARRGARSVRRPGAGPAQARRRGSGTGDPGRRATRRWRASRAWCSNTTTSSGPAAAPA
jgi:hypothetical protein